MKYDSQKHHRRSIRLPEYDYSQEGAYFVTICTHNRECLFGNVVNGEMRLNHFGTIVFDEWMRTQNIRAEITMDEFIVMPNHIHGIVWITTARTNDHIATVPTNDHIATVGANGRSPLRLRRERRRERQRERRTNMGSKTLSSLVAGFKPAVTTRINQIRNTPGMPVWQRNYWEYIIRDENDLNRMCEYIKNNPLRWDMDRNKTRNF